MGATRDDFFKFPRTPHLFGAKGTDDDKHLDRKSSLALLADKSLVIEEKLDGTNVGIHFTKAGRMVLQCRGHELTDGMHPQYDLFKQWAAVKRTLFESILADRFIVFGEWLYARHTLHYRALPHYFFAFDIFDKELGIFLELKARLEILHGSGLEMAPVIHRGAIRPDQVAELIGPSAFQSCLVNPRTGSLDNLMEGHYLRTEATGRVQARAKLVRPEVVEAIKQNEKWDRSAMVENGLAAGVNIWG